MKMNNNSEYYNACGTNSNRIYIAIKKKILHIIITKIDYLHNRYLF